MSLLKVALEFGRDSAVYAERWKEIANSWKDETHRILDWACEEIDRWRDLCDRCWEKYEECLLASMDPESAK